MANFQPLNSYSLFILDKLIKRYNLKEPFLDVACGTGYASEYLAKKGWRGVAIDLHPKVVEIAKEKLKKYKKVNVQKQSFDRSIGKYHTILMFDILEHFQNDVSALKKAHSLLFQGGHLVMAVPSNPKDWEWDDDFYGHFRRYSKKDLEKKLEKAGFTYLVALDYTFPFFWALRKLYTKFIRKKMGKKLDKGKQTKKSSLEYAWGIPFIAKILNQLGLIWLPIYLLQYIFFRKMVSKGSAMMVVAKKENE